MNRKTPHKAPEKTAPRRSTSILFVVGATVLNLCLIGGALTGLLLVYRHLLLPRLPPKVAPWALPIILILGISLAFIIFRLIITLIARRINNQDLPHEGE